MDRQRIEEFSHGEKKFIYLDWSEFKNNNEFRDVTEATKSIITKYPEHSLYTITNIKNVKFDTETKEIVARYMVHNKPYVKYGVVFGMDGIKKMMVNAIFAISGRKNMHFASSKEQAVEWLLKQD